jgi:sarcosine oxidase
MYDAIVIGVGGMGSAAVYHLARAGARVLGLEQFDIPHERGSSHGASRIIRLAYAEHPAYVPLLRRAYELWRTLERETGNSLLLVTGGVDAGAPQSATVRGSLAACATHALPHELLDAPALTRRFPGYRLAADMVAVYQPDAGLLAPERCVVSHVQAALDLNAEVHGRERVLGWRSEERSIRVETAHGRYAARRLVLTAGPWTAHLVPELGELTVPERQVLLWSQPLRPAYFHPGVFPVFNMEAPEGRYYGCPVYGVPGFKIGKYHHRRERVDPDRVDRECHAEDEAVLRIAMSRYFPDAAGPTLSMKTCLFTNSPDEHFIIDRHPGDARVSVAAGFSGHGFKFCSVVGEIMARLALDGVAGCDTSLFRLARFARRAPPE